MHSKIGDTVRILPLTLKKTEKLIDLRVYDIILLNTTFQNLRVKLCSEEFMS
jgi:hypothetical protein